MPNRFRAHAPRLLGALLLLAPAGLLIADTSVRELMDARHEHYERLGEAFKKLLDQTRARNPDMAVVRTAAEAVSKASVNQGRWFPAGSGPEAGKTRALPAIWERPQDFAAAQRMFSDAAPKLLAAANARDIEAVKARFGDVGKACKNCHETFRERED